MKLIAECVVALVYALVLTACLIGSVSCFLAAGKSSDGAFAVAGAVLVFSFFYALNTATPKPR